MNGLDLFSGIGGLSIALKPWVRTMAYCENDRFAQGVLMSRMRTGELERAPIWTDVCSLRREHFLSPVDIIFGGFPCQDISSAGLGAGLEGKRSGLFFEIVRLVDELRPRFTFLENVPAITTRGLGTVIAEFTRIGYDCRWTVVSAKEIGAPHLRRRWFMLASDISVCDQLRGPDQPGSVQRKTKEKSQGWNVTRCIRENMADADGERLQRPRRSESKFNGSSESGWWITEPNVGRVVNGLPHRVDRIRCLGNAVVPMQAREAFERLMGIV